MKQKWLFDPRECAAMHADTVARIQIVGSGTRDLFGAEYAAAFDSLHAQMRRELAADPAVQRYREAVRTVEQADARLMQLVTEAADLDRQIQTAATTETVVSLRRRRMAVEEERTAAEVILPRQRDAVKTARRDADHAFETVAVRCYDAFRVTLLEKKAAALDALAEVAAGPLNALAAATSALAVMGEPATMTRTLRDFHLPAPRPGQAA